MFLLLGARVRDHQKPALTNIHKPDALSEVCLRSVLTHVHHPVVYFGAWPDQPCLFWQPKASNNLERIPLCIITKIITINPPKIKLTHYLFTRMHSSDLDLRHFTWVQVVISIFVAFDWVIIHLLKLINQVLQETSANKSTSDIPLGMKRDHLQMHFSSELVKICSILCELLGFT